MHRGQFDCKNTVLVDELILGGGEGALALSHSFVIRVMRRRRRSTTLSHTFVI
jgi:hypothetical protein